MPTIEQIEVHFATAELRVTKAGVKAEARAASIERIAYQDPLPDLLGYLQSQTELTRSTLVRILKGCGRLPEFLLTPQRFMDAVAATLKAELHTGWQYNPDWAIVKHEDKTLYLMRETMGTKGFPTVSASLYLAQAMTVPGMSRPPGGTGSLAYRRYCISVRPEPTPKKSTPRKNAPHKDFSLMGC
jgi:restriction endonuclease